MSDAAAGRRPLLARIAAAGAALTFAVIVASAQLRLTQSGLGCADWPECDGARMLRAAQHEPALAWVRAAHRLAAAGVALAALFTLALTWRARPRDRTAAGASAALAALTMFLSVLGRATPGSRLPAVMLGNLAGGMAMLALFWWLRARAERGREAGGAAPRALACAALAALAVQIGLGALLSANLGGRACPSLAECREVWWPWTWDWRAFDPWREIAPAPAADLAQRTLNLAHRGGAVLAALLCAALGLALARAGARLRAFVLIAFAAAEIGLGLALVWLDLPLAAALAHGALAALLLLAVVGAAAGPGRGADAG